MITVAFCLWAQAVAVTAGALVTVMVVQAATRRFRTHVLAPCRAAMRRPPAGLGASRPARS